MFLITVSTVGIWKTIGDWGERAQTEKEQCSLIEK